MVVGKAKESRSDYTSSEDDNVLVKAISSNKNSLGYIPFAYYEKNKKSLKSLAINFKEKSVSPNLATIKSGEYKPLSRPLFMYVNKKSLDSKAVSDYLDFFIKNSEAIIKQVNYIPLTQKGYLYATSRLKSKTAGTDFLDHSKISATINKIVF
jgi:phosphate transport system substrate-binding protein